MQATFDKHNKVRQVTGRKIRMGNRQRRWDGEKLIASVERINSREGNKERWDY